jgi:hypothetical protein
MATTQAACLFAFATATRFGSLLGMANDGCVGRISGNGTLIPGMASEGQGEAPMTAGASAGVLLPARP